MKRFILGAALALLSGPAIAANCTLPGDVDTETRVTTRGEPQICRSIAGRNTWITNWPLTTAPAITLDTVPTGGNTANAVSSDGLFTALSAKADKVASVATASVASDGSSMTIVRQDSSMLVVDTSAFLDGRGTTHIVNRTGDLSGIPPAPTAVEVADPKTGDVGLTFYDNNRFGIHTHDGTNWNYQRVINSTPRAFYQSAVDLDLSSLFFVQESSTFEVVNYSNTGSIDFTFPSQNLWLTDASGNRTIQTGVTSFTIPQNHSARMITLAGEIQAVIYPTAAATAAVNLAGQYAGSATTYAGLPALPADADADTRYHVWLTADDIGTGTAQNPQFPAGYYVSDIPGAAWELAAEVAPLAEIPDTTVTTAAGAPYNEPGSIDVAGLDAWHAARLYDSHILTNASFDFAAYVVANSVPEGQPVTVQNVNSVGGINITYAAGHALEYAKVGGNYATVAPGPTTFNLGSTQIAVLSYSGTTTRVSVSEARDKGYYADTAGMSALTSNTLATGDYVHVGAQLWVYDDTSTATAGDFVVVPDDSVGAGRWTRDAGGAVQEVEQSGNYSTGGWLALTNTAIPQATGPTAPNITDLSGVQSLSADIHTPFVSIGGAKFYEADSTTPLTFPLSGTTQTIWAKIPYAGVQVRGTQFILEVVGGQYEARAVESRWVSNADPVANLDATDISSGAGFIANLATATSNPSVGGWGVRNLEIGATWVTTQTEDQAAAWAPATNYVIGDIRSAAEPDAADPDFGKVFNWFHIPAARTSGATFDVAESGFWQRMSPDTQSQNWIDVDSSATAFMLLTYGTKTRVIGDGTASTTINAPTPGGINLNKQFRVANDSNVTINVSMGSLSTREFGDATDDPDTLVALRPGEMLIGTSVSATETRYFIHASANATTATYSGVQLIYGENVRRQTDDQDVSFGVDLRAADYIDFTFTIVSGAEYIWTERFDILSATTFSRPGLPSNYGGQHIDIDVVDLATGTFHFRDAVSDADLVGVRAYGLGVNGYVVPTATVSKVQVTLTVNGGANTIGGGPSAQILEGAGAHRILVDLPVGMILDRAAFEALTLPAGVAANISDATDGTINVEIADGTGNVDLTVPFTPSTPDGVLYNQANQGGVFTTPATIADIGFVLQDGDEINLQLEIGLAAAVWNTLGVVRTTRMEGGPGANSCVFSQVGTNLRLACNNTNGTRTWLKIRR